MLLKAEIPLGLEFSRLAVEHLLSIGLCVLHRGSITVNAYFKRWRLWEKKMSPNRDKVISQALITSA